MHLQLSPALSLTLSLLIVALWRWLLAKSGESPNVAVSYLVGNLEMVEALGTTRRHAQRWFLARRAILPFRLLSKSYPPDSTLLHFLAGHHTTKT